MRRSRCSPSWPSWRARSKRSSPAPSARRMRPADELRELVEAYVDELELADELGALRQPMRYAVDGGGKRLRPVLCLAVAEAAGADVEDALPAAISLELVHTFSLVHDDLPALDDDDERRGRPTIHVAFGEANAILAGDALLAEALRLALSTRLTFATTSPPDRSRWCSPAAATGPARASSAALSGGRRPSP